MIEDKILSAENIKSLTKAQLEVMYSIAQLQIEVLKCLVQGHYPPPHIADSVESILNWYKNWAAKNA